MESIEPIDRVKVDWDRHQLSVDAGQDTMLIGTPLGEPREVLKDFCTVAMEDVRAIPVDQYPGIVIVIERISGDVRALVHNEYPGIVLACQPLCQDAPCETCPDDEIVEHL
jgi:hypothetical protein